MRYTMLFVAILLGGCNYATNDEIITETKRCEAAGLRASTLRNGWDWTIAGIQCEPKTERVGAAR